MEPGQITPPAMHHGTEIPFEADLSPSEPGPRFAFSGSLRRRAARGILINAAFTVGTGLLALVKGFILASFLSRSDYGIWGIVAVSLSTLVFFKQAGVGDKFVQQDEVDQERAFQQAFTFELVATGACVLVLLAAAPVLVLIYGIPELALPCVVIAATLMASAFQAPLWIFYRRMEFGRQQALAVVDPVISFVVSIALAAAGAGYWAFVGGFSAGACSAALAAIIASPYPLRIRWDRAAARHYWSFSAPLLIAGVATFVMAWSATIVTRFELGVAAVGVIALADNVAAFTEQVDTLVTGALYPAICAMKDRLDVLHESLVKSNRLALMWGAPFGLGITLFSSDLVRFGLGERWRPAVFVLQIFGIAAALNQIGFNWTAYLRALGRTVPIAVASSVTVGVFLVTGIPLLLVIGLHGFAIGIAAQGVAALALRAYYLERIFPGFDFLRHAMRSFVPTILATGLILVARVLEPSPRTLAMALGELALYVVVTGAVSWHLESSLVREALGHLLRRRAAPAIS